MSELPKRDLLLPREVQTFLRLSRTALYRWLEEGIIPSKKINGFYRIPRQEFLKWLEREKPEEPEENFLSA